VGKKRKRGGGRVGNLKGEIKELYFLYVSYKRGETSLNIRRRRSYLAK